MFFRPEVRQKRGILALSLGERGNRAAVGEGSLVFKNFKAKRAFVSYRSR